MTTSRRIITNLLALVVLATPAFSAQPPDTIAYQGVLRDSMGVPIDGQVDIVFRFFDASAGGNETLVDEHLATGTGAITVVGGVLNAALGSGNVLDGSGPGTFASLRDVFADSGSVYLELEIDGQTLSPRTQVQSTGFALNSDTLDGLESTTLLDRSSHTGVQLPATINPQGAGSTLNADRLDGLDTGNGSGEIPVSNGTLSVNLNSDLLDGLEASELMAAGTGGSTCGEYYFAFDEFETDGDPDHCVVQPQTFTCPAGRTLIAAVPNNLTGFYAPQTTITPTSITTTCCDVLPENLSSGLSTLCTNSNNTYRSRFNYVYITCCE